MDIVIIMLVALIAMLPIYIWGTILDFRYRCLPVFMCDVIPLIISITAWGFFTYVTILTGLSLSFWIYLLISIGVPLLFLRLNLCGRGDVKMITPLLAVSYLYAFNILVALLAVSFICMLAKPGWFIHKEKEVSDYDKAPFMLIITIALIIQIVFLAFTLCG